MPLHCGSTPLLHDTATTKLGCHPEHRVYGRNTRIQILAMTININITALENIFYPGLARS